MSSDPARPLEAVLFDMDGTLLDSEKIWDAALEDLATHLGGVVSVQARQSMVGSSLWRSVSLLHEDLGISADLIESADYLMARTGALFRTHLAWKPGALELLGAVSAAGIAAALVTSTYRELTEVALDFIGREFFLATVCGDEVTRPKPAPDPYLRAAEFLDVDAMNCVAIEDSPLGIASAESAGCAVLVVPSEVAIEPAPTRTIVSSLRVVDLDLLRALL